MVYKLIYLPLAFYDILYHVGIKSYGEGLIDRLVVRVM